MRPGTRGRNASDVDGRLDNYGDDALYRSIRSQDLGVEKMNEQKQTRRVQNIRGMGEGDYWV